jgi:hypothetical protein
MKRRSKEIKDQKDIDYLLNIDERTACSLSFMMETFGIFKNKRKFEPFDILHVPAGKFGNDKMKNKSAFTTTAGLWVYNKAFIEKDLVHILGYINEPLTSDVTDDINQKITYALLENRIDLEVLKRYIMKEQKFQPYCNILCSSFSEEMLLSTAKIDVKKKELQKKYAKELNGDEASKLMAADKMEKELLSYSKEILKDDPAMDIYNSGAKGSFGNNFKNLFVMKGIIRDPDPTKGYDVCMSNYIDGIKKEDYATMAKSLAEGPYSRAGKTAIGGYWEKLFLKSFQHMVLLPEGTDCGTKRTITVTITKKNVRDYMYSYIKEGSRFVELTSENMDKYIGKTVQFRFSSLCESKDGICHRCIGNFFYRLGIKNIGVVTPQVASKIKLIDMKAFHNSQVKLHEIDVDNMFEE